ncbi:MAG: Rrf2 family transcriptional regulator [Planctomycetota bacterium]|nr:Rrf2 family transcriptional regulator [Planctomycetota bacterium]
MLRISKKADYAVFLLGLIAKRGAYPGGQAEADSVVSAQEIARQAQLNKSVVANLLKGFAKHGILQSSRGLKGGYRLTRSPEEISLGTILEVVDGPFTLVDCLRESDQSKAGTDQTCSLVEFCPTRDPMRIVHERIANLFEEIDLAEMCGLKPVLADLNSPSMPANRPAANNDTHQPPPPRQPTST